MRPRRADTTIEPFAGQAQFDALVANLPIAFALHRIVTNEAGCAIDYVFLQVNRAFEEFTGFPSARIAGKRVTEVIPGIERDHAKWIERYGRVALQGQPESFDEYSESLQKWYRVTAYQAGEGQFATVFSDTTGNRGTEDALAEVTQLSSEVVSQAAVGFVVYDRDLRYVSWNPFMEQLTGISASSLVGKLATEAFPHLHSMGVDELLKRSLAGESVISSDTPFHVPETGRSGWVVGRYAPHRNGKGEVVGVIAAIRDITDRKQAEAEQLKLHAQLQQAMKMEAIGRLTGGIAHDFNNFLTAIKGQLSLARMDMDTDGDVGKRLELAELSTERAESLTRQLLAFSRRQLIEPKTIDLGELAERLRSIVERLIGEDIQVQVVRGAGLGLVRIDPGQVEQVLVNLAVNSRDAMPNGGRLVIDLSNHELGDEYCRVNTGLKPGQYVRIAVSDTGHGMAPEVRQHVFEPFFTTKSISHGTGLGLATTWGIISQAGGSIDVYSELGHGTTFKIYLPVVAGATVPVEAKKPAPPLGRRSGTVLVVEDDSAVRQVAAAMLERLGYVVIVAEGGAEALKKAEQFAGRIDLMMTDMVMPLMNGRELATRMREIRPGTRVLFTSGYPDPAVIDQGMSGQGTEFIGKPYTIGGLSAKIDSILRASG